MLFGSATKRRIVRDVDVGVYLDSEDELRELIRLANMLEDSLGMPVDVVPLRKVQPKLRLKALLEGIRLVVRDRKLYTNLLTMTIAEAEDLNLKLKK